MAGIDAYTVLMLHMDGADTSTTFTDSSLTPKTVTAFGTAQISTAQSVFGGASGLFDGNSDFLRVPDSDDWDFGTGDYTVDFRMRHSGDTQYCILELGTYTTNGILIQRNSDGNFYVVQSNVVRSVAWAPTADTWYHVAIVRQGQYVVVYIDGTAIGTLDFTTTQNLSAGTNGASIGLGFTASNYYFGYLDEFRISKGIARWTANFTPPTEAYSVDASGFTPRRMLLGVG